MNRIRRVFLGLALATLAAMASCAPATAAPPLPTPGQRPHCEVEYLLAPGERAVLACTPYVDIRRPLPQGVVTIQSGHEATDAAYIRRIGHWRQIVFSVTNRSAEPIEATAVVELF